MRNFEITCCLKCKVWFRGNWHGAHWGGGGSDIWIFPKNACAGPLPPVSHCTFSPSPRGLPVIAARPDGLALGSCTPSTPSSLRPKVPRTRRTPASRASHAAVLSTLGRSCRSRPCWATHGVVCPQNERNAFQLPSHAFAMPAPAQGSAARSLRSLADGPAYVGDKF
jgi:hypothetical protein